MRRSCLLLLGAAALALTGCAFGPQLRRVAVNHNELVANSSNELILLNILRARDREPLHFTSVSKLLGDASIQATAGTNVAIRGGTDTTKTNALGELVDTSSVAGTEVTTPSAQLVMSGKTSMDVSVWDTQEFYQGITASVPAGTVAHFLHQGWPADLLTYAFFGGIELVAREDKGAFKKGDVVAVFRNDPHDANASGDFRKIVSCYRLHTVQSTKDDAPLIALSQVEKLSLADLALLDGEKFGIDPDKDKLQQPVPPDRRWIKRLGKTSDVLRLRPVDGAQDCAQLWNTGAERHRRDFLTITPGPEPLKKDLAEGHSNVASGSYFESGLAIPVDVQIVLRSVDGIIYFLGEYIRAPAAAPYDVAGYGGRVPLLVVAEEKPREVFVSTRYKGRRYYVPGNPMGDPANGRSSQLFALVQQLLNLQKSAKDRPTTQTVRVVQ